jgi:hypothetical protein
LAAAGWALANGNSGPSEQDKRRADIRRSIEDTLASYAPEAEKIPPEILLKHQVSPDTVRLMVTKIIIWSYAWFLLGTGAFIIFGGEQATTEHVQWLLDIGKTLFLPVVTFVIGFFFGKSD